MSQAQRVADLLQIIQVVSVGTLGDNLGDEGGTLF
jgi:hypothetical protein